MLKLAVEINERLQVSLTKLSNQQDWNDEESLFHGWRGDALALLFDSWCIILDDPAMLQPAHLNIDNDNGTGEVSSTPPKYRNSKIMAEMALQAYANLFHCYNHSVLLEALLGVDETRTRKRKT